MSQSTLITKADAEALVAKKISEKAGARRRIIHLFEAGGTHYFRVNLISGDLGGLDIQSHWVEVSGDGRVTTK